MKLKLLSLLAILIAAAFSVSAQSKSYKGYNHKGTVYGATLPNGAKDSGGGLMTDENYGVTRFVKGKKTMLWLEKITGRDKSGVPNWQVKDVLTFDKLKKNQEFHFSYSSGCRQNGAENLNLIVLARRVSKSKKFRVLRAWRANTATEKFEKTSIKRIKCGVLQTFEL